jgi:hypothetical protein
MGDRTFTVVLKAPSAAMFLPEDKRREQEARQ